MTTDDVMNAAKAAWQVCDYGDGKVERDDFLRQLEKRVEELEAHDIAVEWEESEYD